LIVYSKAYHRARSSLGKRPGSNIAFQLRQRWTPIVNRASVQSAAEASNSGREDTDRNEIDVHVLVPTPWIEGFPKIYGDRTLAIQAAKLMNDELAAVIASHPRRFRGVAILPVVDPEVGSICYPPRGMSASLLH
jgi:predicted TIM-barrel fold metal-dependent hydrolase